MDGTCGEAATQVSATVDCGKTKRIRGTSNSVSMAGVEELAGLVVWI